MMQQAVNAFVGDCLHDLNPRLIDGV